MALGCSDWLDFNEFAQLDLLFVQLALKCLVVWNALLKCNPLWIETNVDRIIEKRRYAF